MPALIIKYCGNHKRSMLLRKVHLQCNKAFRKPDEFMSTRVHILCATKAHTSKAGRTTTIVAPACTSATFLHAIVFLRNSKTTWSLCTQAYKLLNKHKYAMTLRHICSSRQSEKYRWLSCTNMVKSNTHHKHKHLHTVLLESYSHTQLTTCVRIHMLVELDINDNGEPTKILQDVKTSL